MLDAPQLRGIGKAMGDALEEQRKQFEVQITLLETRIAKLEALLGLPASAPAQGAPAARH